MSEKRKNNVNKKENNSDKAKPKTGKRKKRLPVEIREMEIDDVATVFHMGEELFTSRQAPNLYRTWDEYEVVSLFLSDSEYCLVAEIEDKIVGFALGTTVEKARSAWKYGILIWLGVDPKYQRYGIAKKLYRQMRNLMKEDGARILLVDTEADNDAAVEFFRKMGFGNVEEHVYLSANLGAKPRKSRKAGLKKSTGPLMKKSG